MVDFDLWRPLLVWKYVKGIELMLIQGLLYLVFISLIDAWPFG